MGRRFRRRASKASSSKAKTRKSEDVVISEVYRDTSTELDSEYAVSTSDKVMLDISSSDCDAGRSGCAKRSTRKRRAKSKKTEQSNNDDLDMLDESLEINLPVQGRPKKRRNHRRHASALIWEVWQEENERWLDAHEIDDSELESPDGTVLTEVANPPSELTVSLLRFQKEWLAWGLKMESSDIKGGILADEMGMGKTIQAISLVITARSIRGDAVGASDPSDFKLPKIKSTLVVCPLVAVIQWVNEIKRFTAEGTVKVLVYHGAQRGKSGLNQLPEYDVVITTYSTVESDFRKFMMPSKERCKWCEKLFLPEKMNIHLKYYCGPDALKTEKQSKQFKKRKQPTKNKKQLLCATSSRKGIPDEEENSVGDIFEGSSDQEEGGKIKKLRQNALSNSGATSAGVGTSGKRSVLHSVMWERIILDEAHFIKDRRCNTARAVLSLESRYKWALSGTPLQNRVGELYSLVRFLQLLPFSYYFCKDCDCRALDYSTSAECKHCEHKAVRHFCWWNRYIAAPIQKYGYTGPGRRAMILLKKKLLHAIVLRRTKKGRAADLALPLRIVSVRRDSFDNKEEDFYEALYSQSQAQFNTYINAGILMNNYAHIFDLLTRLRQAVDHPYLVIYSRTSTTYKNENNAAHSCGICHEDAEDAVVTSCGHIFCKTCLMEYSTIEGRVPCPCCSKPLSADFTTKRSQDELSAVTTVKGFRRSSILNKICLKDFQSSTKIEALREEIRFMVEADRSAKGIVFSQFTSFLDLINYSLQKSGVKCVQLVGSMSIAARDEAINRFSDDPDCKIFLMSLKAGGIALNLTVASHVFLMDPWWNPAVEQQAQDRIHRIGQYKPIRTVRFVIDKTIEERILRLQEKKKLVFEGTVGGSSEALGKLTEADLRFLFHT